MWWQGAALRRSRQCACLAQSSSAYQTASTHFSSAVQRRGRFPKAGRHSVQTRLGSGLAKGSITAAVRRPPSGLQAWVLELRGEHLVVHQSVLSLRMVQAKAVQFSTGWRQGGCSGICSSFSTASHMCCTAHGAQLTGNRMAPPCRRPGQSVLKPPAVGCTASAVCCGGLVVDARCAVARVGAPGNARQLDKGVAACKPGDAGCAKPRLAFLAGLAVQWACTHSIPRFEGAQTSEGQVAKACLPSSLDWLSTVRCTCPFRVLPSALMLTSQHHSLFVSTSPARGAGKQRVAKASEQCAWRQ